MVATVLTPLDCVAVEQKLERWLVKPIDGFFARMNGRVSLPISRQIADVKGVKKREHQHAEGPND